MLFIKLIRLWTRNPDKYSNNAEQNRIRAIDAERRKIRLRAVQQAQRLAAIHDPTGALFNVNPVVTTNDGSVITQEAFRRRQEKAAEKAAAASQAHAEDAKGALEAKTKTSRTMGQDAPLPNAYFMPQDNMNADRFAELEGANASPHRSKNQQKRIATLRRDNLHLSLGFRDGSLYSKVKRTGFRSGI